MAGNPERGESATRRSWLARVGLLVFGGGWLWFAMRAARSNRRRPPRVVDTGVRADQLSSPVVVASAVLSRDRTGAVMALDRRCTHLGCLVGLAEDRATLVCPCHGSVFALDGERVSGPAQTSLRRLAARVDQAGKVWLDERD